MKRYSLLTIMLIPVCTLAQINSGDLITKNGYFEIPFTETKKEIRLKASLKGEESEFMLDSGAPAFISKEIQGKYKFPYLMRARTRDASGKKMRTDIVTLDTVKVGPFIFTNIPALVLDMKNSPIGCMGLSGNIGSNMLRHLIVQFNLKSSRVALTDQEGLLKQHLTSSGPMHIDGQSDASFPVKINDDLTDTIHFDSGDGQLFEISKRKAAQYAAARPADIVRKGYGTLSMGIGGVGESFQQYVFKPGSIQIGNTKITGGTIVIAGNDKSRMGRELFHYGIFQLNYKESTFAFQPYTSYTSNNYDYGFKLIPDEDIVIASCVWENAQAGQLGMTTDDQILKINDIDFTRLSRCDMETQARNVLQQNAPSISVTFKHKKQSPKTITLQKKML